MMGYRFLARNFFLFIFFNLKQKEAIIIPTPDMKYDACLIICDENNKSYLLPNVIYLYLYVVCVQINNG